MRIMWSNTSGASFQDGSFPCSGIPGEEMVKMTHDAAGGQIDKSIVAEFFCHHMHYPLQCSLIPTGSQGALQPVPYLLV